MLLYSVLVLLVGLYLLDEQFESTTIALEQHTSHARHPRATDSLSTAPWGTPGPWAPIGQEAGSPHPAAQHPPHPSPLITHHSQHAV